MLLNKISNITFDKIASPLGELEITLVLDTRTTSPATTFVGNASLLSLQLLTLPKKKYDWNDKEFWFGIGNCTISVYDPLEYLENALRDVYFNYKTSSITVTKVSDSSIWFKGFFDSDQYTKNFKNEVELVFSPLTELLAQKAVQKNGVWDTTAISGITTDDQFYNLQDFITLALQSLIDSTMVVTFHSNIEYFVNGIGIIGPWGFSDLYVYIRGLFQGKNGVYNTTTYKDVINNICRTFGFALIFTDFNKADFIHYLNYQDSELITPDFYEDVSDFNRTKNNSPIGSITGDVSDYPIGATGLSYTVSYNPNYTGLPENQIQLGRLINKLNFRVIANDGTLSEQRDIGTLPLKETFAHLLEYYGRYYTSPYIQIEDSFTLKNLTLLITNKLLIKEYFYFPLLIEYDLEKNETKVTGRPFAKIVEHNQKEYPIYEEDLYNAPETPNPNTPGFQDGNKITNELITIINGVSEYALINSYKFNSLEVFRNGQKQTKGVEYTETSNEVFTWLIVVTSDEYISVNYNIL